VLRDDVQRLGLSVGTLMSPRLGEALLDAGAAVAAYDRAVALLAARARSSFDLRRAVLRAGISAPHADRAIQRLIDSGLLDDASFARQFVRVRAARLSRRALAIHLRRRGIERDVATEAVTAVLAEEGIEERDTLEVQAEKRFHSLAALDAATRKRRLYSYLMRRGYDSAAIADVIKRLSAGREGG
jgi:regulatory protein